MDRGEGPGPRALDPKGSEPLSRALEGAVLRAAPEFSAHGMANVAWAFGRAGRFDERVIEALSAPAISKMCHP